MKKRITLLISIPHLLFWLTYVSLNIILVSQFLTADLVIKRVSFIIGINAPVYLISYYYFVPRFFIRKKYPAFYLLSFGMLFGTILLRYYLDPLVISPRLLPMNNGVVLVSLIFISQAMIIFISSLIAIAKESFLMDKQLLDLSLQKKEADLQSLKAKVNPHFLLNTLNNIYARTYAENSPSAEAILQLSQLLRYTIYDGSKEKITLGREMETIQSLIGLYELKFEKKLPISLQHPPLDDLDSIELPSMVLFTLVENAIKHSAIGLDQEASIEASLQLFEKHVVFEIANSIAARPAEKTEYKGFGMLNLQKLLNSTYADKYKLITTKTDKKYHIQLHLPYEFA